MRFAGRGDRKSGRGSSAIEAISGRGMEASGIRSNKGSAMGSNNMSVGLYISIIIFCKDLMLPGQPKNHQFNYLSARPAKAFHFPLFFSVCRESDRMSRRNEAQQITAQVWIFRYHTLHLVVISLIRVANEPRQPSHERLQI